MLDFHCSPDYFKNYNESLMFPKLGFNSINNHYIQNK